MNSVRDQAWLDYFHGGFTEGSHQLLSWGYQDARGKIGSDDTEEAISKAIVRAIKTRQNAFDMPERFENFFVEVETHPMEDDRSGINCPRIDIAVEGNHIKPRPHFVFEAKRLKKGSHSIGGYVGKDGLGCFLCCQYAENYPSAAMIGYMQDENSFSHWKKELNKTFKNVSKFNVKKHLEDYSASPNSFPYERVSCHGRTKNGQVHSDIRIHHIFLECHTI